MNTANRYADLNKMHYVCSGAKAEDVTDDGAFKGYAAVFGNVDQGNDMIIAGAFAETLRDRGDKVRVLWNHSSQDPIGRPTEMREDNYGLFVEGMLNQEVQRGKEARALLKQGDIDGMSIGYRVNKGGVTYDEDTGIYKLTSLTLREFSIVTFPMNESAVTTGIKTEAHQITTVRQFEEFLLDTTSFTRKQAAAVASHGFKESSNLGEPDGDDISNAGELQLDLEGAIRAIKKINMPVHRRAVITT